MFVCSCKLRNYLCDLKFKNTCIKDADKSDESYDPFDEEEKTISTTDTRNGGSTRINDSFAFP